MILDPRREFKNLILKHYFFLVEIIVLVCVKCILLQLFTMLSTYRWTTIVTNVGVTVKRLSDTRWSTHYEAVKTVHANFKKLVDTTEELRDPTETVETRRAVQMLVSSCTYAVKMRRLLNDKRNEIVKLPLQFATNTCEEMDIPLLKRRTIRKKKMMSGEKAQYVPLTLNEELKRSMLEFIDRFYYQEIDTCCKKMESISAQFAVL
ncbi:hypothetical protein PR048_028249 [Dryococelus australis]|uniref:Uncharacterized protein n=1 Tax=Dryococelus australis TaxID=614101 RepID=A0ABQ9GIT5_9NEOP|nr:hypothetical protein PR048_028249 [Dryococelus australis]